MEYFRILSFAKNLIYESCNREKKYTIDVMLEQGYKQIEVARVIDKDKSVVNRDIGRNFDKCSHKYRCCLAQKNYVGRIEEKAKHVKFTDTVKKYIEEKLEDM